MKPSCRKGRDEHSIELPKRGDDGTWYIYHDLSMMIVNRDGYSFFPPTWNFSFERLQSFVNSDGVFNRS